MLTAATDPGANAFMPTAASPPPTSTQPMPTLQPQGDGNSVATQPLPGDRDGLYGGTNNNAEIDRDKIVDFYGTHPAQADAFVEVLNADPALYWSGARRLVAADIPVYLRELTPVVLRLDTRITNHGFLGAQPTVLQSIFQAGTAVLVDAHGIPRVRGLSGNPLTMPIALRGAPRFVGAAWPGYRAGALAEVVATAAAIANFVLVDLVTGNAFNRPVGTTGGADTPHTQPVVAPGSTATAAPPKDQAPAQSLSGTYLIHYTYYQCYGLVSTVPDIRFGVKQQGNTITIGGFTGPLNADGSFVASGANGPTDHLTFRGVFATEGGHTVIRDGHEDDNFCRETFVGTKQ